MMYAPSNFTELNFQGCNVIYVVLKNYKHEIHSQEDPCGRRLMPVIEIIMLGINLLPLSLI